jgi:hypothetical protein
MRDLEAAVAVWPARENAAQAVLENVRAAPGH